MKNNSAMKIWTVLVMYLSFMILGSALARAQELVASQEIVKDPVCEEDNCQQPPIPYRSNVPLGARISDALTRQDRELAADILAHERLLLNDEMSLLNLLGRDNEAADVAFTLMERSALDEALYEQASALLMKNSRHSGVMTTVHAFESYTAVNNQINTFGHQLGSLKVDLMYFQEARSNVDTALLNNATNESGGEIAINQGADDYGNILKVQVSQAFNTQYGISLNHVRKIGTRLKFDVQLAHNQTATDNAALRIMGRVHQASLEGVYSVDSYNQWIVSGGHNQYFTVDGQELGTGDLLTSTLSHELSAVRPAMHARMTGTWSQFQIANTTLSGNAASLIPVGFAKSAAYFMPQKVDEIAAYVTVGDTTDSALPAHDLEAFCELGVFDNAATGSGWRGSAGFAGRLIGADRLQLFVRYDQSPNGQGFSSWEAGIGYLLHY